MPLEVHFHVNVSLDLLQLPKMVDELAKGLTKLSRVSDELKVITDLLSADAGKLTEAVKAVAANASDLKAANAALSETIKTLQDEEVSENSITALKAVEAQFTGVQDGLTAIVTPPAASAPPADVSPDPAPEPPAPVADPVPANPPADVIA